MSTPPLLELPSSACIASVIMTMTNVVGITVSPFTLEEQAFNWPGQAWSMDLKMPPFNNRKAAMDWVTFGLKLKGMYGRFLMGDPSAKKPRGAASGTPVIDGNNQTGNTLMTKGWTNSTAGILLKGDYIQVGSGIESRLHMVTEDINSDGSGKAAIAIEPALRSPPLDNSAVVTENAKGLFKLNGNQWSWSVDPGPVYRLSFQAVEVINA